MKHKLCIPQNATVVYRKEVSEKVKLITNCGKQHKHYNDNYRLDLFFY